MILPILILINSLNFGNIANNCKSGMNVQSPSLLPPPGRDVARRTQADSYGQRQWAGELMEAARTMESVGSSLNQGWLPNIKKVLCR